MNPTAKQLQILIVDDDSLIREELHESLTENEYQVLLAASPSQAFELTAQNLPDIVILDVKLPEMDGLEVLKRLNHDYPDMEIIMITGHGDMGSVI